MGAIKDIEKDEIIYSSYEEYDSSAFILNDNDIVLNPKNDVKGGYSLTKSIVVRIITVFLLSLTLLTATVAFSDGSLPAFASMTEEEAGELESDDEAEEDCGRLDIGCKVKQGIQGFTDGVKGVFCAVGAANGSLPEMAAGGVGGLFTDPASQVVKAGQGLAGTGLDTSKPYTAYEKYGTSGTNWTFYRDKIEGVQEYSCFPVDKVVSNLIANGVFSVTEMVSVFAAWSYGFATGTDNFDKLIDAVDDIMGNGTDGGLVDTLYLNYLTPLLVIGALWLFWMGIVKRAFSRTGSGLVWMLLSTVTSLAILYNASGLINFSNDIVQGVVSETTDSIGAIGNTSSGGTSPNNLDDLCSLPGSNNVFKGGSSKVERTVKCRIWEAFVYFPWATGQYGVPPNQGELKGGDITTDIKLGPGNTKKMDVRAAQLDAQSLDYTIKFTEMGKALPKKVGNYKKIEKYMTTDETARGFSSTWSGNDGMNRLGIAFFSVIAAIGGTIIIISISVSMIIYQLGTIFLLLVAPLFLLLGAHPGFGRGIALKWAELLVESVLKRIVLAIFISVIVSVFIFLVSNTGDIGFIETVFLLVAMSIAGMMYKSKFLELVGRLNFGGTQTGMEGGAQKVRSTLLGTAGAVAGGVGALGTAGTAGRAARSLAKAQGLSDKKAGRAAFGAAVKTAARGTIGGYAGGSSAQGGVGSLAKGAMAGRFNSQGAEAPYVAQEDRIREQHEKEEAARLKAQEDLKRAEKEDAEASRALADREAREAEQERRAMHDMNMYNAMSTIGGMIGAGLFPHMMKKPETARAHGSGTMKTAIDIDEKEKEQRRATAPTIKPQQSTTETGRVRPAGRGTTASSRGQTGVPSSEADTEVRSTRGKQSPEEGTIIDSPESASARPEQASQTRRPAERRRTEPEEGPVIDVSKNTQQTTSRSQERPDIIQSTTVQRDNNRPTGTRRQPPKNETKTPPPPSGENKTTQTKRSQTSKDNKEPNNRRSQAPKMERGTGSPLISRKNDDKK